MLLKNVTQVISKYPATVFTGVVGLVLQCVFSVLWLVALGGVLLRLQNDMKQQGQQASGAVVYAIIVYMVFSMYWIVSCFLLFEQLILF